jgi:hypothetical protein
MVEALQRGVSKPKGKLRQDLRNEMKARLGEAFYEQRDWSTAAKWYRDVGPDAGATWQWMAAYKLAWTGVYTADCQSSASALVKVARLQSDEEARVEIGKSSGHPGWTRETATALAHCLLGTYGPPKRPASLEALDKAVPGLAGEVRKAMEAVKNPPTK